MKEWTSEEWRQFAGLAIHAAGTTVAQKRSWQEMLLCAGRDALDIAIELAAAEKL